MRSNKQKKQQAQMMMIRRSYNPEACRLLMGLVEQCVGHVVELAMHPHASRVLQVSGDRTHRVTTFAS